MKKGEWDVVAQLSFQIQSKQVHGAADELLYQLMHAATSNASERWNVLSFAERSLEFLVLSPKVRREITRVALAFWLEHARQSTRATMVADEPRGREIVEHIGNLLLVTAENRDTIGDEIEIFLKAAVLGDDKVESSLAAELSLDLTLPLHSAGGRRQVPGELTKFWDAVSERITAVARDRLIAIGR